MYALVALLFFACVIAYTADVYMSGKQRERQAMLAWHLALATVRGRSLPEELRAFADDTPHARQRRRLHDAAAAVEGGRPLAEALLGQKLLPSWMITSIAVAERSGRLPETLAADARRLVREPVYGRTGGSLLGSAVYLSLLLLTAASVLGFISYFIVPKFKRIFEGFEVELPILTEQVIEFSDLTASYYYLIVPVLMLVGGGVTYFAWMAHRGWGEFDPPMLLRRQLRFDTPNLARDLAVGIEGAIPLPTTLRAIAATHRRAHVRYRLGEAAADVDTGADPWEALGEQGFLSRTEVGLLRSAERVGNLPAVLRELAESRERRWLYRTYALAQFVEPAVVVGMGIVIGILCCAFFLPIVKLINDLS